MLTPPSHPASLPSGSSDDELLNDLLDERLSAPQSRALEARLEREPLLREAYDELLRTRELFRAAPDPEPPADFTARVRARLESEPAATAPTSKPQTPLQLLRETAPGPAPRAATSLPVEVPRLWKRLMVTAYAAAALLMVGIGVVSLRRGSPSETNAGHAPAIETARVVPEKERSGWDEEESQAPGEAPGKASGELAAKLPGSLAGKEDKAEALAAAPDRSRTADEAKLAAPLLPGSLEAEREKALRVGETAATGGAGGRGAPRLGPGGSVRPGLREPSDAAPAAQPAAPPPSLPPAAPAPAPAAPAADPLAQPGPRDGYAPGDEPAPELATAPPNEPLPAEPVANVLLLEAPTAVEGRALVALVLAGPSARAADADGAPAGFTRVLLRRADARADGVLLARLRVALPARDGAPSAGSSPPKDARPPAPAAAPGAPSASAPTTPPVSGPARVPAAGADVPAPTVLADFWQDLNAEQQARLEALLGPMPSAAPAPSGGGGGAAAPAAALSVPRRVRIVITASKEAASR